MKNPTKKEIKKLLDEKKKEELKQRENEKKLKKKVKEMFEAKKFEDKQAIKVKLNRQGIKKIVGKFAEKINKMLNEDINENIEIGTKKVGNTKVDYGIRMKFLDDKEKENKNVKWIKKKKEEK